MLLLPRWVSTIQVIAFAHPSHFLSQSYAIKTKNSPTSPALEFLSLFIPRYPPRSRFFEWRMVRNCKRALRHTSPYNFALAAQTSFPVILSPIAAPLWGWMSLESWKWCKSERFEQVFWNVTPRESRGFSPNESKMQQETARQPNRANGW